MPTLYIDRDTVGNHKPAPLPVIHVGDRRIQNQPGTSQEYPNWRAPLTHPDGARMFLEKAFSHERARQLGNVMNGGPMGARRRYP